MRITNGAFPLPPRRLFPFVVPVRETQAKSALFLKGGKSRFEIVTKLVFLYKNVILLKHRENAVVFRKTITISYNNRFAERMETYALRFSLLAEKRCHVGIDFS